MRTLLKSPIYLFILPLLILLDCVRPQNQSDIDAGALEVSSFCPATRPEARPIMSRAVPRVQKNLAPRMAAAVPGAGRCVIDHRSTLPKTFQFQTGFCHVHAFAELWNTTVEPRYQVDAASLSLQIWMLRAGPTLDAMLESEVRFIRRAVESQPIRTLTGPNSMFLLGIRPQGGNMADDLLFLQKSGAYTVEDAPRLSYQEVEALTVKIHDARKAIIQESMRGISDERIKETIAPIYQEILDRAWRSRNQAEEWQRLEPSKKYAEALTMKEITYLDSQAARLDFLDELKKHPLGVSRSSHAIVVAGYDAETHEVLIRDSLSRDSYYTLELDEFFIGVSRFFYLGQAQ